MRKLNWIFEQLNHRIISWLSTVPFCINFYRIFIPFRCTDFRRWSRVIILNLSVNLPIEHISVNCIGCFQNFVKQIYQWLLSITFYRYFNSILNKLLSNFYSLKKFGLFLIYYLEVVSSFHYRIYILEYDQQTYQWLLSITLNSIKWAKYRLNK